MIKGPASLQRGVSSGFQTQTEQFSRLVRNG